MFVKTTLKFYCIATVVLHWFLSQYKALFQYYITHTSYNTLSLLHFWNTEFTLIFAYFKLKNTFKKWTWQFYISRNVCNLILLFSPQKYVTETLVFLKTPGRCTESWTSDGKKSKRNNLLYSKCKFSLDR